jgi:hypothetical protein
MPYAYTGLDTPGVSRTSAPVNSRPVGDCLRGLAFDRGLRRIFLLGDELPRLVVYSILLCTS